MEPSGNDLKVFSTYIIDTDPDKLTKLLNALQLARQNTLPGQVMIIPIQVPAGHPPIAFRYAPESAKGRVLGPPAPAADQVTKGYIDKQPSS